MMKTLKTIVIAMLIVAVSTSGAWAIWCDCANNQCSINGQLYTGAACAACGCVGSSSSGPQPYSRPVDTQFLKNNFHYNWQDMMQFMREAYAPIPQSVIIDLYGRYGLGNDQPPWMPAPGQYELRQEEYETYIIETEKIKLTIPTPGIQPAPQLDQWMMRLLMAGFAVAMGLDSEDAPLMDKIADRMNEKLEAIREMFPSLNELDNETMKKLYTDAINEVKANEAKKNN